MKTASAAVAFSALVALAPSALAQMTVSTPPSVVECEPVQFAWNGGSPPYYLSLVPDGQPAGPAVKQFPKQSGVSYTWMENLPAGTAFNIALKDNTGAQAFSAPVVVQAGTDQSCLNTKVDEGASGSVASGSATNPAGSPGATSMSNGASAQAVTHAAATPAPSATSSPTPAKAAAGGTSAASSAMTSPTSKNAARGVVESATNAAMGIAGIMGLVGVVLL